MGLTLNTTLNALLLFAGVLMGMILAVGFSSMAEDSELDSGPRAIPYNGILEYNGQSLNGQADLRFTLSDDPSGENVNCLFTEEHDNVTAYAGRFSVNIGQVTGDLPGCVFDSDAIYIEVGVREATANEDEDPTNDDYVALSGSQRIHPVPFSYWAAEGADFRVDGNAHISGMMNVNGAATIGGNTDVGGNINVSNDIDISGNARIEGNAVVNGFLEADSDVSINGGAVVFDDLSVGGVTNLDGVVNVDRRVSFGNSFDSNGVLDQENDYKLMLFSGGSPINSYGFGIQSNTLFANSFSEYDFKIGGVDRFNLTATDATFNTNVNAAGNVSINQGLSVGGDLAMTGRLLVSTDTNDSGFPSEGTLRLPSNYEPGTTLCRTVGNRRRVVVGARLVVISGDQLAIQLVCAD